jgi:serine O-acetyltransferase
MKESFINNLYSLHSNNWPWHIDTKKAISFIDDLFTQLFVGEAKEDSTKHAIEKKLATLQQELIFLLQPIEGIAYNTIAKEFFTALPQIHSTLLQDAQTIHNQDPAANNLQEVLMSYPGFYATAIYRMAHWLHQQQVPILPRVFAEWAHSKTGIDIHPAATIGNNFCIDHGTGIVIGATATIGNHVKIYQGVTLGALSVQKDAPLTKRHPTIEDHVVIYSNATILGGDTVISKHSIIGGNVWLTNSVAAYSIVYHKSHVTIRDKNLPPNAYYFEI